jgi:hypothetical protein
MKIMDASFYAHLGTSTLLVWNDTGKVALPKTTDMKDKILNHKNRIPEPPIEKTKRKRLVNMHLYGNLKPSNHRQII